MIKFFKRYGFIVVIGLVFFLTITFYNLFSKSESFQSLLNWADSNLFLLICILVILKIIAIVWPPLPGIVFMIAAIPVIGWQAAFVTDMVGGLLGSSLVFGLSRKYGSRVVLKVFGEHGLRQVSRFKFKPNREFEAIAVMRVFTSAISELISYGAGLTNIKFRNFFFGTLISHLVVGTPLFYLLGFALSGGSLWFALIPLSVGLILLYTLRGRYFLIED